MDYFPEILFYNPFRYMAMHVLIFVTCRRFAAW